MLHHSIPQYDTIIENACYDDVGFAVYEGLLSNDLIDRVLRETRTKDDPLDKWKRNKTDAILELAYHKVVTDILRNLYKAEPFPFQTLNFEFSPAIGLHADTIHFNTDPTGWMCGVWVALEDVTLDNGPLQYFPRSHKLPVVTFESLGLEPTKKKEIFHRNLGVYTGWLENRNTENGWKPKTLVCNKGTILIWHANLMHKSIQPKPGMTRTSQVTHYYFRVPGVKYTVPAFGSSYEKTDTYALEQYATNHFVAKYGSYRPL